MRVQDARFVAAAERLADLPPPAFAEVAFAGRSNVGKSSLINKLVGRKKLVRTSNTPGCTRAINLFRVELRELPPNGEKAVLDLVDLPGFGYARRSKAERLSWGPLIEGFLKTRPGLRAVVLIIDVRRGFQTEELELLRFLREIPLAPICVATKLDKLSPNQRPVRLKELQRESGESLTGTSATDGLGLDRLWKRILTASGIGDLGPRSER